MDDKDQIRQAWWAKVRASGRMAHVYFMCLVAVAIFTIAPVLGIATQAIAHGLRRALLGA